MEVRRGRELDAHVTDRSPAEAIDDAERRWHGALDELNAAYGNLPTIGDLDLAMALARELTPRTPLERPTAALGRALAGVMVETQRQMVRDYQPAICASYAATVMVVWGDWEEAEKEYRQAQVGTDIALRNHLQAKVRHFRALMPHVLFLWAVNEERRAMRALIVVPGCPVDIARVLFDTEATEEIYSDLIASLVCHESEEARNLAEAAQFRAKCQRLKDEAQPYYRSPMLTVRKAFEREMEGESNG